MKAAGAAAVLAATAGVAFYGMAASSAQSPATTITTPPTTATGSPTTVTVPIPATTVAPTTSTSPPRTRDRLEIERQRVAEAAAARPVTARPEFTG